MTTTAIDIGALKPLGKTIRFGILGYGKMGRIRGSSLAELTSCQVVGFHDPHYSGELPPIRRYDQAEDLIASPEIDAVIICTPNFLTRDYVVASLRHGKHVFAEKPPGRNLGEVLEIQEAHREALRKSSVKLMFGFNHRHHESISRAKEIVDSGEYGDILWMRGRYGKSVAPDFHKTWRAKKDLAGGGIFLDQGIHMLDLFLHMAGSFDEVKAFVSNLYWKGDVEDNVFAIFRNKKGQVASLHSTMTQWRHLFSFEIFLEKGHIVINGLRTSSNTYGEETLSCARNQSASHTSVMWGDEINEIYTTDESWKRELGVFVRAIAEDLEISTCGIDDAVDLMRMVEAVYSQ
jgi:predicted dehydrogenase